MSEPLTARIDRQGAVTELSPGLAARLGLDDGPLNATGLASLLQLPEPEGLAIAVYDADRGSQSSLRFTWPDGMPAQLRLFPLASAGDGDFLAWIEGAEGSPDKDLLAILERIMGISGDDFFCALALELAASFQILNVVVGRALDPDATRIRTVAFVRDGEVVDNLEYETANTPCGTSIRDGFYFCPEEVQQAFPEDLDLGLMDAHSYLGYAVKGPDGKTLGQICLLHDEPLSQVGTAKAVLSLCASRAAAEFRREEELNLRHQLLSRVQDYARNIPGWVYSLLRKNDGTFRYLFSNQGAHSLFGPKTAERLLQDPASYSSFLHPQDREHYVNVFIPQREDGEPYEWDYRVRHDDGGYRWMRSIGQTRQEERGLVIHGLLLDLEKQKELEHQRNELTQQLTHLVEAVPDAIMLKDSEGRLRIVNQQGMTLMRLHQLRWQGRTYQELAEMVPELKADYLEGARQDQNAWNRRAQLTYTELLPVPGVDRAHTFIVSKIPLFEEDGSHLGLVTVIRDVTESLDADRRRRSLEAQAHRVSKLETVGRMAEAVAHKFENLLTAVIGYSDLLLPLAQELPQPQRLESGLGKIHSAAHRASELARDLLAFGLRRPDGVGSVEIHPLMAELEAVLGALAGSEIKIRLDIEEQDSELAIRREDLADTLLHLVTNARDAMPAGGVIKIRGHQLRLSEEQAQRRPPLKPGNWYRLDVVDQGVGMDKRVLEKIFDPYYSTHADGQRQGLGLALVQGHATRVGGSVEIESQLGQGTRVRLWLPLAIQKEHTSKASPTPTILLVEDEPLLLDLARRTLEACGYQVHCAADLAEGRRHLDEFGASLDLLIADVLLPDGTGVELAEALRGVNPSTSVLLASGLPQDVLAAQGVTLPAGAELLLKPYRPTQFLAIVAELLNRGQAGLGAQGAYTSVSDPDESSHQSL